MSGNNAPTSDIPIEVVMRGRRSVRAFLPTAVSQEMVADILSTAASAPSGTNTQPWQVIAVAGEVRKRLCDRVVEAFNHEQGEHQSEYDIYPAEFVEPYLTRRRRCGLALYAAVGISKGNTAAMRAQHTRNFTFFDAPVGLIFILDRRMALSSWVDYGMFLQNIMLAARARGLDTCAQMAWALYPRILGEILAIPDQHMVLCGMALGYADPAAAENSVRTEREPVKNFTRFCGF